MYSLSVILALTTIVAGTIADFTTGPSLLRITGKTNSSLNGYAEACHAGAANEGLCYVEQAPKDYDFYHFYYNYTIDGNGIKKGIIIYMLDYNGSPNSGHLDSAVRLEPELGSNLNLAFIPAGVERPTIFSVGDDGKFYISGLRDDRASNETQPEFGGNRDLANFHLCWQWVEFYWLYSIAWATTLPPQNPSCQPVDLELVGPHDQ
ncbi:hypothetical protein E0Z10_g9839 [Xylaria hypoxylon]|uniref:Uncharacterized protein n=1 Tax=Xylaria hypoxylon TaxID=37992 RepID=A0A4Z0Y7K4_9PEZI|nr:hypothetical protein E0Z10_g9839 [Xylaria hypoxylon]